MSAPAKVVPLYRRTTLDTVLKVADEYPVFPCRSKDEIIGSELMTAKSPLVAGGFKPASVDTSRVSDWWGRWPEALVGVPTGRRTGIVVVDIDPAGLAWYEAHQAELPITQINRSHRGFHLLFNDPLTDDVGSSTGKIANGVDVRGDGGYVIWWPAHGYPVENQGAIAEIPDWLLAEITNASRPKPSEPVHPLLEKRPTAHTIEDATTILQQIDPDVGYDDWINIGMALEHQFGPDGLKRWNSWSSEGKKYRSIGDLKAHWRTFRRNSREDAITFRTVLDMAAQQAKPAAGIPILDVSTFLKRSPPQWRVKGLLPQTGLALIFGASGSGKTFLALDLVISIVGGTCWSRSELPVKQGRGVYVAAEGPGGFRNRVEARKNCDLSGMFVIPAAPLITTDVAVDQLIEAIQGSGGTDVVVLDTLSQVTSGIDENSSLMSAAIRAAIRLRESFNCLVIFIGHSGKDPAKGHRGWTGVYAAVDTAIEVVESNSIRTATVAKQRDGEGGTQYSFTLQRVTIGRDEDGDPITTCVLEHCDTPFTQAPKRKPHGERQNIVYGVMREGIEDESSIISRSAEKLKRGDGKDRRREYAKRALEQLVENEVVVQDGQLFKLA